MNKRIKELAGQCGFRVNPSVYDRNQSFDIEKFAELIIEECTTVIERNLFKGIGWNTSRAVKQHFGMEDEEC